ncbi:MAG: TIR domain-containing protein [Solirubrobacteraceae bacterium]
MSYDVMLSHAGAEDDISITVANHLTGAGLNVWRDRDRLSLGSPAPFGESLLPPGTSLQAGVNDAIDQAAVFLFLDSGSWRRSPYCTSEYDRASQQGKRIIALAAEPPDALRPDAFVAAERLDVTELDRLTEVTHRGLDVARAHAGLTQALNRSEARGIAKRVSAELRGQGYGGLVSNAVTLAGANLEELGISLSDQCAELVTHALRFQRSRRAWIGTLVASVATVVIALSAIAFVARSGAISSRNTAVATARRLASLADATASETATSTGTKLADAKLAIEHNVNPTSLAAYRDAVAQAQTGYDTTIAEPATPSAVAVSNTGRVVAIVGRSGTLSIVHLSATGPEVRTLLTAQAKHRIELTPSGAEAIIGRGVSGSAAVVNTSSGSIANVHGTTGVAGILPVSAHRVIAVEANGDVVLFDPTAAQPSAVRIGTTPNSSVLDATIAGVGSRDTVRILSLDTAGQIALTQFPGGRVLWSDSLLNASEVRGGRIDPTAQFDAMQTCGHDIDVLAEAAPRGVSQSFTVPFTITPSSRVLATGSLLISFGLVCLPEGTALADDVVNGPHPFPTGPSLAGFAANASGHVTYAIGSSTNDAWAVAAGSDGSLTLDRLDVAPQVYDLPNVGSVGADSANALVATSRGQLETLTPGRSPVAISAPGIEGDPARGTFTAPGIGTVFGIGANLVVVRDGAVTKRIPLPAAAKGIRPSSQAGTVIVTPFRESQLYVVSLHDGASQAITLPSEIAEEGGPADVAQLLSRNLVIATPDGSLTLLSPRGRVLTQERRDVPGPVELARVRQRLLVGTSDGEVQLIDSRLQSIRQLDVLTGHVVDLEPDASGQLVAVEGVDSGVVLDVANFAAIGTIGPLIGFNSVTFAPEDREVIAGAAVVNGDREDASLSTWPVCLPCASGLSAVNKVPAALASPVKATAGSFTPFAP